MVDAVLAELPPLISEGDMHVSQMALSFLSTLALTHPASLGQLGGGSILQQLITLVRSPLLQGGALAAMLDFYQVGARAWVRRAAWRTRDRPVCLCAGAGCHGDAGTGLHGPAEDANGAGLLAERRPPPQTGLLLHRQVRGGADTGVSRRGAGRGGTVHPGGRWDLLGHFLSNLPGWTENDWFLSLTSLKSTRN